VWRDKLNASVTAQGEPPALSQPLREQIKRRVPPGSLAKYLRLDRAIALCTNELELIATRIRQYPMIEIYPNYFSAKDRSVYAAFLTHLHSLRANDLYLIQERGVQLMRFTYFLTQNLGMQSVDQSRTFEKSFKKEFGWRLRERHRLTHVHERPSLMTRLLDVMSSNINKEQMKDVLVDLVIKLSTAFDSLKSGKNKTPEEVDFQKTTQEMRRVHVRSFETETAEMWRLVESNFRATCPQLFLDGVRAKPLS
jgi:hypothetical protein